MIKNEMIEALNKQMRDEFYSSYLYLSMSGYFEHIGLKGGAHWMFVQHQEELDHAIGFFNYIKSQNAEVKLLMIQEPPDKWDSIIAVFKETLKHEEHVTLSINDLVDTAEKNRDRATFNFLQKFVDEQVEEEEQVQNVIDNLNLIGDNKSALFLFDRELGQRVYIPPAK